jgi:hypothetical protein
MENKVAILGYTREEASRYNIFKLYNIADAECISISHSNFLANNDFDSYIDHDIAHKDIEFLPKQIAYSWYRNDQHIDNYKNQFSVGIAMQTKVESLVSYNLKYYLTFKRLFQKYTLVILPENINHDLLIIIKLFNANTIVHNDFSEDMNALNQITQTLGKISKYPINKYSPYMYKIQKFLSLVPNKKTLVFADWTYEHYRSNCYLYQNSKNILNGFYTKNPSKNISKFINSFPENVDVNNSILNEINERVMNKIDKNNLSYLFKEVISHEYKLSLENLCRSYLIIKDIFTSYKPKQFICATINHPWHTIMAEISREMKIKSNIVLDGYATYLDKLYYSKDSKNKKYLFDNYAFSGSLAEELSNKYFPQVKGDLIKFPISDLIPKKENVINERYDALVMMLYPKYGNPNSHYDQRFQYVLDIIKILIRNNYKKIAIKMKNANKKRVTYELKLMKNVLLSNSLGDLEIYGGNLHDIIHDTGLIVGQAGTALIESNIANTPYYIYEPSYSGLSDNDIERSVFKDTYYARTLADLEANIAMLRDSILDRNKLVDGSTMTDILN